MRRLLSLVPLLAVLVASGAEAQSAGTGNLVRVNCPTCSLVDSSLTLGTAPAASAGQVSAVNFKSSAANAAQAISLATSGARICTNASCGCYLADDTFGTLNIICPGGTSTASAFTAGSLTTSGLVAATGTGNFLDSQNTTVPFQALSRAASGTTAYSLNRLVTGAATDLAINIQNNTVSAISVQNSGKIASPFTDLSGTPGSGTANSPTFRAAIASGASAATITDSTVLSTSIVKCQVEQTAKGVGALVAAPASGSVVVTSVSATGVAQNATANCNFSCLVMN